MTRAEFAGHLVFVLRCAGAAMLSYSAAAAVGLQHPVWASVSSVVVSQMRLNDTESAVLWRLVGTLTGIVVAVAAGSLAQAFALGIPVQIGCGVALCAIAACRWPGLRVAMWTVPIVYFSQTAHVPLIEAGFWRGVEVMLGGLIGAALHWLAETSIRRWQMLRHQSDSAERVE